MTEEQGRLLACLPRAIYEGCAYEGRDQDLLEEARVQAVSSLVCRDYAVLAANVRVIAAHVELTRSLEGLPFTTFKGYASASHYPKPALRPMGDVDFIADRDSLPSILERLGDGGWRRGSSEHVRHTTFYKVGVHFELHTEIKGVPNGLDGIATPSRVAEARVRRQLSDVVGTARRADTQYGPIAVPDDYHHALVMLLHVAGHMANDGGVGLRHLCDWAAFARRVDVGGLRPGLEEVGLWTFARQLTAVSERHLGLPPRPWAGTWDDGFLDALMEDFLGAGNFGRREPGRALSSELEGGSLLDALGRRFPEVEGHPWLVPARMARWAARYASRVMSGERGRVKVSTLLGARSRRELYEQFRLFEV